MSSLELAKELQQVIKEDYGKNVSVDEAAGILDNLVGYFDLLAKMRHQSEYDVISESLDHESPKESRK